MPSFKVAMENNSNGGKKEWFIDPANRVPEVLTGVGSYFDKSEQKNKDDRKKSKILEQGVKSDNKRSNNTWFSPISNIRPICYSPFPPTTTLLDDVDATCSFRSFIERSMKEAVRGEDKDTHMRHKDER
ncbi:uncharacterized protein MYCFIDRAFT_174067 [Pseudocercospora fijiensis CIRAD86]|uniref:Uncharacterized protein n=1 Tax=Pseudocercospora fijiensis (strain CIRAD86) TaxID=383855 RepID=M3B7E3_PSEFD|nr:uncharacterized protein MYCFIDRAFT_174067 [Pseudocercospora fijiensis CIRAD86]EME85237.1 hypothetical protein MYCFIDRAFT_174067 [Pseudocercospora fijiensis CIRAD86]